MKTDFSKSLVPPSSEHDYLEKLELKREEMQQATTKGYVTPFASINLPFDEAMRNHVKDVASQFQDVDTLVVIGIGGSNLGTLAIHDAVRGSLHNLTANKKLLFAETVDPAQTQQISTHIEHELKQGKRVVYNVISKSGSTTEPIAILASLLPVLKQYKQDWQQHVVATTGEDSKLFNYAKKHSMQMLLVPEQVGGRYSVLSPVGLFPLAVMGIDIDALCQGAREMRDTCLTPRNDAMKSAAFIYHHFTIGKNIHDTFLFSKNLESIGRWYRQLLGESVGKEFDLDDKRVLVGITPNISIGSTDLHSMSQLFLGGPYDKTFTLVSLANQGGFPIPNDEELDSLVEDIRGKDLGTVMSAIHHGVQSAFTKQHRPFISVKLKDVSEKSMGEFLQFKMMEMIYLAHLMHVNPFNQPNVEAYKIETKKALSGEIQHIVQESVQPPRHSGKVYLGADHAGYAFKEAIKQHLEKQGVDVEDLGTYSEEPVDYPRYAQRVGSMVARTGARGILVCGTGTGMSIAANKIPGVRAQVAYDAYSAEMGRKDNNTNVLCLRGREADLQETLGTVDTWMQTSFSGELRHQRRIDELGDVSCNE